MTDEEVLEKLTLSKVAALHRRTQEAESDARRVARQFEGALRHATSRMCMQRKLRFMWKNRCRALEAMLADRGVTYDEVLLALRVADKKTEKK